MKKKFIACILIGLLMVNSLGGVPVSATVFDAQNDSSSKDVESYHGGNGAEGTGEDMSIVTDNPPVVEEDMQLEDVVPAKEGKNDESLNNLEDTESIPIDVERFPDEKFRQYISGKDFDKNQDGYFSPEEISEITSISAWLSEEDKPDFTDMRGVEYFTKLTWLSIVISEPMGQVDFGKMPLLEHLSINASTMSLIDLNENNQLRELYIDNSISELILPDDNSIEVFSFTAGNLDQSCLQRMKRLRTLEVYGQTTQKLDTSYCDELESLELNMKLLPELDLTKNQKLMRLKIYGTANQNKLDLSENKKLNELVIQTSSGEDGGCYGYIDMENSDLSVADIEQYYTLSRGLDASYALGNLEGYNPSRLRAVYGAEISSGKLYPKERYVTYEYYLNSRKDKYATLKFDCGKQINPEVVEGLTITGKTETSISCKWITSKNPYTGYVIYAKNAATGKNEKRIVLKKGTVSYKVTGLKPGGRYEIIVRAYRTYAGKNYYSVYYKGTAFSYTMPAKPTLKVSSSGKKVKYTWSHKKADYRKADSGYLLYYSTNKKGPYTRAVILPDTKKNYSINLKSGRTYYFKMRAYVQYNKQTSPTFSKFSNVVTKKL